MTQRGWAMPVVVLVCGLMASATLQVALDMAVAQSGATQRQALMHAQAAAEALIQLALRSWSQAPAAPAVGCTQGRCAWLGDAALSREHWLGWLDAAVPAQGWSADTAWSTQWPTLPQAHLAHWVESTPSPDGVLLRITAWVGDATGRPWTVMQAVWQIDPSGSGGQWIGWREVMP